MVANPMAYPPSYPRSRRGRWRFSLLLFAVLGLLILSAAVSEAKRIAFVVGISQYDNFADHQQLDNSVYDARAVSQTLGDLGFEVIDGINLTVSEFDKKWKQVLDSTTSEDTLVFFFSGHGVEVHKENFLLPRDMPYFQHGRHKQFQRKSVSLFDLMDDLRMGDRQPPKVTVMILDACRDDPTIPPEFKPKGGAPRGGLAEIPKDKAKGTFIMYAAAPGKVALDRLGPEDQQKKSVYTRTLLPLLKQPSLSIQDLAIKVREEVYKSTKKVGFEQLPEYTDGLIGRFCLAGCQTRDAPEEPFELARVPVLDMDDLMKPGTPDKKDTPTKPALREITGKDGAPMVFIPGGVFLQGGQGIADNRPQKVAVKPFYIDKFEVTIERYARFLNEAHEKERTPADWDEVDFDNHRSHPVAGTNYYDASSYCRWAGKRLPTNSEWEKAARGTDGRVYPWGNQEPKETMTNFNKNYCLFCNVYDEKLRPVGTFHRTKVLMGFLTWPVMSRNGWKEGTGGEGIGERGASWAGWSLPGFTRMEKDKKIPVVMWTRDFDVHSPSADVLPVDFPDACGDFLPRTAIDRHTIGRQISPHSHSTGERKNSEDNRAIQTPVLSNAGKAGERVQ